MQLPEICIKRPVFATVLSLIILLVGIISYTRLSVREYPRIDEPVVSVSVTYRGASAEVVESQVTKPLEDSLVRHRGRRGDDVAEPVGDEPHQRPLHAEARPRLRGRRRPRQGGARARQAARHDRRADHRQGRGRFAAHHLHRGAGRIADAARGVRLRQALRAAARSPCCRAPPTSGSSASGRCRCGSTSTARGSPPTSSPCRTSRTRSAGRTRRSRRGASNRRRASSPSSPRPTCGCRSSSTTSSSPTSAAIRCASATSGAAEIGPVDERVISRYNGKPSLNIGVIKQAVANPLDLSKAVRAEVAKMNEGLPTGMKLVVAYDTSVFIDRSIKSVFETIAEAIAAGRARHLLLPAQPAGDDHPDRHDPGVAGRRVRAHVPVRIHRQHAVAARDGAGDRPRRRRRHRDAGEHPPAHRGGQAAHRGGDRRARARSASRSSR